MSAVAKLKSTSPATAAESVVLRGDLRPLSEEERLAYYKSVCESLGVNPLTQPFGYIEFQGKLRLYALRACTDQLRRIHGVSVSEMEMDERDGVMTVTVRVKDAGGREDVDIGCVVVAGLKGEALANARMKALTKGKRRATLSICGLGWLDESELDTVAEARVEPGVGRPTPAPAPRALPRLARPRDGNELYNRVEARDHQLAEEGVSRLGDLIDTVSALGDRENQPEEWSKWPAAFIPIAYQHAVDWEKERRAQKAAGAAADPSPE